MSLTYVDFCIQVFLFQVEAESQLITSLPWVWKKKLLQVVAVSQVFQGTRHSASRSLLLSSNQNICTLSHIKQDPLIDVLVLDGLRFSRVTIWNTILSADEALHHICRHHHIDYIGLRCFSYHDLPSSAPHRYRYTRVRKATASCYPYGIADMLSLSSELDLGGQWRGINRPAGSPSWTSTHEYMFYLADQKFKIHLCWTACW